MAGVQPPGSTVDRRVARIAARQHEIVSLADLRAAGMTRQQIKTRVARATLHRIHVGVYAVGSGRLTGRSRWMAGVVAGGEGAVLALGSAAALWGIGPAVISPVHVVVARKRRDRPGLRFHRHRLGPGDVTVRDGIPVTSVPRTLSDLPKPLRARAESRAVVLGLLDRACLEGPLFRSEAERRFHAANAPPLTNVVIEGRERDFAWPEERLVVEVDGPHHDLPHQRELDRRRDEELRRAGWRVRRVRADEV